MIDNHYLWTINDNVGYPFQAMHDDLASNQSAHLCEWAQPRSPPDISWVWREDRLLNAMWAAVDFAHTLCQLLLMRVPLHFSPLIFDIYSSIAPLPGLGTALQSEVSPQSGESTRHVGSLGDGFPQFMAAACSSNSRCSSWNSHWHTDTCSSSKILKGQGWILIMVLTNWGMLKQIMISSWYVVRIKPTSGVRETAIPGQAWNNSVEIQYGAEQSMKIVNQWLNSRSRRHELINTCWAKKFHINWQCTQYRTSCCEAGKVNHESSPPLSW